MSQQDALNRIVGALHDAALDESRWPAASALIDEACRMKGNMLVFGDGQRHDAAILMARFCYRGQRDEAGEREYFRDYYPRDERVPRVRQLPDSRLVHVRSLYTEQEAKRSAAYNEALPRSHTRNSLHVRLDGPDGARIVWVLADPIGGREWSPAQTGLIRRLLPHIRQYVRVRHALAEADALGESLAALLDNARSAVIQLDRRGAIVAANDGARALLRRGDGLCDRNGSLRARAPAEDAALQRLLARALPRFGGQGAGGSMTVTRGPDLPRLVLHLSPVEDERSGHPREARRRARADRRPGGPGAHRPGAGGGGARAYADGEPRGGVAGRGQDRARHRAGAGPHGEHGPLAHEEHLQQARHLPAIRAGAAGAGAGRPAGAAGRARARPRLTRARGRAKDRPTRSVMDRTTDHMRCMRRTRHRAPREERPRREAARGTVTAVACTPLRVAGVPRATAFRNCFRDSAGSSGISGIRRD